jgi:DNA-binding transcriptional regulator YiaG
MTAIELRAALKRFGVKQGEVAVTLGVHWVTVSRWCRGEMEVPRYVVAYLELLDQVAAR